MSTATMTSRQAIEEYIKALSESPKTETLIDRFVDDPNLKQHILQFEAAFPGYQVVPQQIVAQEDLVAINATVTAVHKGEFAGIPATGKTVTIGAMMFYQVENGRIKKFWMQADMAGGIAQLKA
jgi:steroid delta-isomerase-like uncharacterized protein